MDGIVKGYFGYGVDFGSLKDFDGGFNGVNY